jgi:hypothetical protein
MEPVWNSKVLVRNTFHACLNVAQIGNAICKSQRLTCPNPTETIPLHTSLVLWSRRKTWRHAYTEPVCNSKVLVRNTFHACFMRCADDRQCNWQIPEIHKDQSNQHHFTAYKPCTMDPIESFAKLEPAWNSKVLVRNAIRSCFMRWADDRHCNLQIPGIDMHHPKWDHSNEYKPCTMDQSGDLPKWNHWGIPRCWWEMPYKPVSVMSRSAMQQANPRDPQGPVQPTPFHCIQALYYGPDRKLCQAGTSV